MLRSAGNHLDVGGLFRPDLPTDTAAGIPITTLPSGTSIPSEHHRAGGDDAPLADGASPSTFSLHADQPAAADPRAVDDRRMSDGYIILDHLHAPAARSPMTALSCALRPEPHPIHDDDGGARITAPNHTFAHVRVSHRRRSPRSSRTPARPGGFVPSHCTW